MSVRKLGLTRAVDLQREMEVAIKLIEYASGEAVKLMTFSSCEDRKSKKIAIQRMAQDLAALMRQIQKRIV